MQAEFWAVLTAICWAAGSLLEKTGIRTGGFTPVMGTTIRTLFSLVLLAFISHPFWGEVRTAGARPVLLIAIGGGVLAGGLGIIFLYTGLKHGNLSTVTTIAFCLTPVIGAILGLLVLKEKLTPLQLTGMVMCIAGAAITVLSRAPKAVT